MPLFTPFLAQKPPLPILILGINRNARGSRTPPGADFGPCVGQFRARGGLGDREPPSDCGLFPTILVLTGSKQGAREIGSGSWQSEGLQINRFAAGSERAIGSREDAFCLLKIDRGVGLLGVARVGFFRGLSAFRRPEKMIARTPSGAI